MNAFWKRVLYTGLLVGTTDIISAYIDQYIKTGFFAKKMLLYIAGGALGLQRSMAGGFWVGVLGLFFHYFIAFSFTLLFFVAYPRLRFLRFNPYVTGLLYGVFVSCCMQFLVLPLSLVPPGRFGWAGALKGWVILGVVLGIPIVLSARWYYKLPTAVSIKDIRG